MYDYNGVPHTENQLRDIYDDTYRDRGVMTRYRDVLEAALLDDSITVERRKSLRLSRDVLNNTIANLPD